MLAHLQLTDRRSPGSEKSGARRRGSEDAGFQRRGGRRGGSRGHGDDKAQHCESDASHNVIAAARALRAN